MSRYRIKPQKSIIIDFWLVQQQRWWGWHTIARFVVQHSTIEEVKKYIEDMKQLEEVS